MYYRIVREYPEAVRSKATLLNTPSDTTPHPNALPVQNHFDLRAVVRRRQRIDQPPRDTNLVQDPLQPAPIYARQRCLNDQKDEAGVGADVVEKRIDRRVGADDVGCILAPQHNSPLIALHDLPRYHLEQHA